MRRWWTILQWTVALVFAAGLLFALWWISPLHDRRHVDGGGTPVAETTDEPQQPAQPDDGLEKLVGTIATQKGDYAIAVIEPNGRKASANGDKKYTAASTYKLFIAYGVFQRISDGTLEWSDKIHGDYNAEQCFEFMIVQSHNDCTYAFGDLVGWQAIDDMMDRLGLHDTQVKFQDNSTTADDLALYLEKLENGTLLNNTDTQKLLDAMKRQIHRDGIPAGIDVPVADKPGFLYGLLHDAGIVYGQKGTYVLVILSNNSSWGELADAAKQIHTYLEQ